MKIVPLTSDKAQITLESGSLAILTFKQGKFTSINVLKAKKSNAIVHAVTCTTAQELIVIEQTCENFVNCDKIATVTSGYSQETYESNGQRGLVTQAWAFCKSDYPEAFQLIMRSQDGSLVSVTPLGNVMWLREEGLASIKARGPCPPYTL